MTASTHLEPLTEGRARELLGLLHQASADENTGLALDAEGRVLGLLAVDDPRAEHVLGDLDVHA